MMRSAVPAIKSVYPASTAIRIQALAASALVPNVAFRPSRIRQALMR